jgi:Reverse transcriptase (RNA-dependent DNA polymerase)
MITLEVLLSKGYFPRELPPPFTTDKYAAFLSDGSEIPNDLLEKCPRSRSATYNLARAGTLRRKLSVLNPFSYLKLSKLCLEKWDALESLATRSPLSLTKPVTTDPDRAIERQTPLKEFPARKAAVRYSARYVLKTDISRFYNSIYTHSIPWVIHGKAKAKRNTGPSLWGNTLDKLIRDSQDGQTMGIPVGPDLSLLIAEMLLSAVDRELVRNTGVRGLRYIDDYELSFDTLAEAERVQGVLQGLLSDYELALNAAKTTIYTLPLQLQEPWVSELGHFALRTREKAQHTDLLRYFDRAFELSRNYPSEGVLKYAVGKAANLDVHQENRTLFQDLLLQCATVEPGCLPMILRVLCRFKVQEDAEREIEKITSSTDILDARKLEMTFNAIIKSHAAQGHSSEVCWALWGCILFGAKVVTESADALIAMGDPAAALLGLHAQEENLLPRKNYLKPFEKFLTAQDLYGEHWILAYEANIKGWLRSPIEKDKDNVASDPRFSILKANMVEFYDKAQVEEAFDRAARETAGEESEEPEVPELEYFG